jgi:hypothetical protein
MAGEPTNWKMYALISLKKWTKKVAAGNGAGGNRTAKRNYSIYWSLMITVRLSDLPSGRLLS